MSKYLLNALILFCSAAVAQEVLGEPNQVDVAVKVVEFQTTKTSETGLSAYFRNTAMAAGAVIDGDGEIMTADLTFPSSTAAGITVFLDRIALNDGDLEMVLQALVNENKALIISRPRAMVMMREPTPTVIETTKTIPYETTVVVGATTVQVTEFKDTGVSLNLNALDIIDDDGDWTTTNDTYVLLRIEAEVTEEGQRRVIALDNQSSGGSLFTEANNAISVPEFITRRVETEVWVRHGEVLVLGGLFRSSKTNSLASIPWLTQGEDLVFGAADRFIPGDHTGNPLSSVLGSRAAQEEHRELAFLIKAESWYPGPALSLAEGFAEAEGRLGSKPRLHPTEVIQDVLKGISELPEDITKGVTGGRRGGGIESTLGGQD